MVKEYGYYNQLLQLIKSKKELPIWRINNIGGRMGAKTFSGIDFIILASLVAKVKTYAFRYMAEDKQKLWEQFLEIIDTYPGLRDQLKLNITLKKMTFPNGSVIEIYGLHKQKNDEVKLTGLAGATGFDYGFALAEERYEISDGEWAAVLQAIRGFDKFMEIHLANPWINTNDYVKYCVDALPFDLNKLKESGQQFLVKDGEIFHYSNYQINNFLTEADKRKLLQAAKHDPQRANTILYGYPGVPEGSVWKHVLDKMFRVCDWEKPNKYVGCVDYGEKGDATAAYNIAYSPSYRHAHAEKEYYWANKKGQHEFKDTFKLATEVVEHFIDIYDGLDNFNADYDVFVDSAAIPFITALNNVCAEYGYDGAIHFYQSKKYKVAERVEQMKTLASFGMLTVGTDCPQLRRELQEQTYSKSATEYVDGDDHGTDTIAYGLANKWVELLDNLELVKQEELEKEA